MSNAEFDSWARALANHKGKMSKSYPSLNHLLVSGAGPSTPSEYQKTAHADQAVIDDIAHWVRGDLTDRAR